ncbi:uncharacterized protein K452DRAFT_167236 [Aplosporella prunicola CBS 121167]|uniref:non-specific serine/threonine protein kinase n=1 Tax=Aplosporella prunicola CBS 121167 TaxID=1176127 RepID=A0A6A6BG74_9PEZI|nr:uncharacterized protein K452DRAFT_167236 [Aplosporella prunicola CBS 121167]KAF2143170.1 hypothetical protein K452DRAFT_167236 [Aplosporella prunicola CBS 121167]
MSEESSQDPTVSAGKRLASYFSPIPQKFEDVQIQDITILLRAQQERWSHFPRTYIVLRIINRLDLLNNLLDVGFTDHWFPVTPQALPPNLQPSVRSAIAKAQSAVLTQSVELEKGPNGSHGHYRKGDVLPFRILGKLGGGAYGQVDRIQSSISMKQYALKRIRRRAIYGNKTRESHKMFISEMNIIKELKHHHMVEFVGSYTDATFLGLIMAPVADMNLSEFLDKTSSTDVSKAAKTSNITTLRTFFGCLASALQYLHDNSVRHRDIKPQNILVECGNVLFTDFGLSKDYSGESGSTTSGITANTPRYAAPEVSNYDPRNTSADVWSLGCVFLEMTAVLKGFTLAFLKEFFSEHGTEHTHFCFNQPATAQLIEILTYRNQHDNKPVRIIKDMLKADRHSRPTAAQVFSAFITLAPFDTTELVTSFCGICCLGDEESDSHDSLCNDLDTSMSGEQHADAQLSMSETVIKASTAETVMKASTVDDVSNIPAEESDPETSTAEHIPKLEDFSSSSDESLMDTHRTGQVPTMEVYKDVSPISTDDELSQTSAAGQIPMMAVYEDVSPISTDDELSQTSRPKKNSQTSSDKSNSKQLGDTNIQRTSETGTHLQTLKSGSSQQFLGSVPDPWTAKAGPLESAQSSKTPDHNQKSSTDSDTGIEPGHGKTKTIVTLRPISPEEMAFQYPSLLPSSPSNSFSVSDQGGKRSSRHRTVLRAKSVPSIKDKIYSARRVAK